MARAGGSIWDTVSGEGGGKVSEKKKEIKEEADAPKLDTEELRRVYRTAGGLLDDITSEVRKVVVGQEEVIEQVLVSIFTDSHALLEGFPGLGKTLLVNTLADIMELDFKRIQCTPDLMPSDITGTYVVEDDDSGRKVFRFEKGPVFTNILLADEINRATPKAQSALLEAMQERQVTAGTSTQVLEKPFLVLATQNPIEMEGTYPLPEAQVDRFLLKIMVKYPSKEEEDKIIELYTSSERPETSVVLTRDKLLALQQLALKMPISSDLRTHALNIVTATRPLNGGIAKKYLDYGASPRASIGLVLAAKARALLHGRNYVSREDIESVAYSVLRHRLILNFESERKGVTVDEVISGIMKEV